MRKLRKSQNKCLKGERGEFFLQCDLIFFSKDCMGGLDAIVFTGGIGEHSALVRRKAVESLGFLDIAISEAANQTNAPQISLPQSKVRVLVMETNEEIMIARQIAECLQ